VLREIGMRHAEVDCKRKAYGGFEVLVDAIAPQGAR
jgi:hypothetical protein